MSISQKFEVDYHTFCPKCKHWGLPDMEMPCNKCLAEPYNWDSVRPTEYKERTEYDERMERMNRK